MSIVPFPRDVIIEPLWHCVTGAERIVAVALGRKARAWYVAEDILTRRLRLRVEGMNRMEFPFGYIEAKDIGDVSFGGIGFTYSQMDQGITETFLVPWDSSKPIVPLVLELDDPMDLWRPNVLYQRNGDCHYWIPRSNICAAGVHHHFAPTYVPQPVPGGGMNIHFQGLVSGPWRDLHAAVVYRPRILVAVVERNGILYRVRLSPEVREMPSSRSKKVVKR